MGGKGGDTIVVALKRDDIASCFVWVMLPCSREMELFLTTLVSHQRSIMKNYAPIVNVA